MSGALGSRLLQRLCGPLPAHLSTNTRWSYVITESACQLLRDQLAAGHVLAQHRGVGGRHGRQLDP
jgi:hypothetical protein